MKQLLYLLGLYFKDRAILSGTIIALLGIQLAAWSLWFRIDELPKEVPLWYTASPINQLADVQWLWFIPGLAAGLWLVNVGLGVWLYRKYSTISQMLVVVAAAGGLLAAVAMIKTIMIFTELL